MNHHLLIQSGAQTFEVGQTFKCLVAPALGVEVQDTGRQKVDLAVQVIDSLKGWGIARPGQEFSVQPRAKSAPVVVQLGWVVAVAPDEGFEGNDPGAMLDGGAK
jgi:hypothetical protein